MRAREFRAVSRLGTVLVLIFLIPTSCDLIAPSPEASPKVGGGRVIVGLNDVDSLDPATATSFGSLMILRTACDGLTRVSSDGETVGALANEWTVTEGGKKVTFQLRRNAEFSDGTAVSAQNFVESMSRLVRPEAQSPWGSLLADVEGFAEVQRGEARILSGARALDESTLEVVLTNPAADLPAVLSHSPFVPTADIPNGIPICAGPFRISRSEDGRKINLQRTVSAKGLDEIELRIFDTALDAYAAFRNKEAAASIVPDDSVSEASGVTRGYLRGETPELTFLGIDITKPPTDNQKLRQALSLALDRLATIDATFGDRRPPALRWAAGLGEEGPTTCSDLIRRISDPGRATQLLGESGVDPAGVQLPLYFDQTRISRLVAQALEVQLSDTLGLRLSTSPLDPPALEASIRDRTGSGLWILTAGGGLPIPGLVLDPLFRSGGAENRFGFSNSDVDAALLEARQSPDADERERAYLRVENLVCEQMPAIPLWRGVRHWSYDPGKLTFDSRDELDFAGALILRNASVP